MRYKKTSRPVIVLPLNLHLFVFYLEKNQDTLTDYLDVLDVPIEEFYSQVREVQEDCNDPYLKQFVKCLLASADYESFYKVMSREGRAFKIKRVSEERRSSKGEPLDDEIRPGGSTNIAPTAEAKSTSRDYDDDYKSGSKEAAKDVDSPRDYK